MSILCNVAVTKILPVPVPLDLEFQRARTTAAPEGLGKAVLASSVPMLVTVLARGGGVARRVDVIANALDPTGGIKVPEAPVNDLNLVALTGASDLGVQPLGGKVLDLAVLRPGLARVLAPIKVADHDPSRDHDLNRVKDPNHRVLPVHLSALLLLSVPDPQAALVPLPDLVLVLTDRSEGVRFVKRKQRQPLQVPSPQKT